jgi:ABC-2 type transport system ATP-binding protein
VLDIKELRAEPEEARRRLQLRGDPELPSRVDRALELDEERRDLIGEVEELRALRNEKSKEIGEMKRRGEDASALIERMGEVADRIDELLDLVDLADVADKEAGEFSGGMKKRLDVATALVHDPPLVFLDEPTTGLDPRSRNQVWEIIREIAAGGTTVLLTTQYLDEADRLADRLAVVDNGRVIAEGTSDELKAAVGASTLQVRVRDPARRAEAASLLEDLTGVEVHDGARRDGLTASVEDEAAAAAALSALGGAGIRVGEFSLGQVSLDEVFLALTGRPAEPARAQPETAMAEAPGAES